MVGQATIAKKFVVRLSAAERDRLGEIIHKGKHSAQRIMKARILVCLDETSKQLIAETRVPVPMKPADEAGPAGAGRS